VSESARDNRGHEHLNWTSPFYFA